ncbi:hypothetical protein L596_030018 [Steinernema carpocapsae]|uniref:Uncharacterized protein n=1 Tax=Steinernema carpocapsae TaxID=34508 RepID=A0A4U5LRH4_STECR|nr:hypothetical protein L596_030018 [Steinernema carpocapsae]
MRSIYCGTCVWPPYCIFQQDVVKQDRSLVPAFSDRNRQCKVLRPTQTGHYPNGEIGLEECSGPKDCSVHRECSDACLLHQRSLEETFLTRYDD